MPLRMLEPYEWVNVKRDPSTGLGTLALLYETLDRYLQDGSGSIALLQIDIDHVAPLNHRLGYATVNDIIDHLVRLVRAILHEMHLMMHDEMHNEGHAETHPGGRGEELFCRIGGDEFAVLLPGIDIDGAAALAETIRDRFAREGMADAPEPVTVSIGVAAVPESAGDLGSLITAADLAVLEAKRIGRNTVSVQRNLSSAAPELAVAARIIGGLARRIVETGALLEDAQEAAFTDPVTALPNHRAMNRFLDYEYQRAARYGSAFSILMIDGDSLKRINDALGHEAGNDWIRLIADILCRHTRASDLVARWFAGDEFVIILTETAAPDAITTAERIRAEVEREAQAMPIPATVSIGVAAFPRDGVSVQEVLKYADRANGEAKRLGRNRVVDYRSLIPEDA